MTTKYKSGDLFFIPWNKKIIVLRSKSTTALGKWDTFNLTDAEDRTILVDSLDKAYYLGNTRTISHDIMFRIRNET